MLARAVAESLADFRRWRSVLYAVSCVALGIYPDRVCSSLGATAGTNDRYVKSSTSCFNHQTRANRPVLQRIMGYAHHRFSFGVRQSGMFMVCVLTWTLRLAVHLSSNWPASTSENE